jgi:GntR family transcriptional regulator
VNADTQAVASRRIADEFAAKIESGELGPGARLPSERVVAPAYGVARNTVQAAMRLLTEAGRVVTEHGRGMFVRRAAPLIRLGSDRYSPKCRESGPSPFLIECERAGKHGRFEVLSIEQVCPPADVAERLHIDPDSRSVLRRKNVFWADDDPVYLVTTYVPWTIAAGTGLLEAEVPHPYGIHGVLEEQGYPMARLDDYATACMPTLAERDKLGIESGVPLLDLTHVSVRADDTPYELKRFVMRGDMSSISYNVPVE